MLGKKFEAAAEKRSARRAPSRDGGQRPSPREIPTVSEAGEIKYYARELKRLRTERLQSHFAAAVEEYKTNLSPAELRHMWGDPEAYDARARHLAARLLAVAAEKGVDLKRTSLDADAVLEIARAAVGGEITRDQERRGAHLRDRAELPAAAAQRAERVGRALGSVLHQEVRCKFQEELAAGRGGGADRDELLLVRHELGLAKERLAVAREQSRRPGLEEGPVRPLLTGAKESDIARMLDAIGDAGFRKAYREKLMQSGLIQEEVHDRVHVR